MNIIFISSLFPKTLLSEIQKYSKVNIDNAANALQWHMLKGISEQLNSMDVITAPHIGSFPFFYKKLFIQENRFQIYKNIKGISVRYCNMSLVKQYFIYSVLKKTLKAHLRTFVDSDTVIIVYGMLAPYVKAAIEIKKDYPKIKICIIIPDIPEYMSNSGGLVWALRMSMKENLYKYIDDIDGFVLLTDAMAEALKIQKKLWIRVEGMIDPDEYNDKEKETNISKKILLYTGTLAYRYGIIDLLNAFEEINNVDYELWICGAGNTERLIKHKAINDKRIKYLGLISREIVLQIQRSATVLINPRSSKGEYTKFSFPSKTMEYLLSGKPVIMRKLPSIPEEYHKHLFFPVDDSVEALKNIIVDVCEMSTKSRALFGSTAREFVLKEKNCFVQNEKIIRLILSL